MMLPSARTAQPPVSVDHVDGVAIEVVAHHDAAHPSFALDDGDPAPEVRGVCRRLLACGA